MKKTITAIVLMVTTIFLYATVARAFYASRVYTGPSQLYRIDRFKDARDRFRPAIRIMPLGDSITHGYRNDYGGRDVDGYRKPLYDMLVADGYSIDFVGSTNTCEHCDFDADHQGQVGKSAKFLKEEVFDLLQAYHPDMILLHIGTNDIKNETAANPNGFDRVGVFDDVQAIIDEVERYQDVYDKHVTVIMADRIIDQAPRDAYTTLFNDYLEHAIVGENLILVNMETGAGLDYRLVVDGGDMRDRYHPNSNGYAKIAAVWYSAIASYLTDPLNRWTQRHAGTSAFLYDLHHGDGQFIAVGSYGSLLTSGDGQSWSRQNAGTSNTLHGVTDSNGLFVAVGSNGTVSTSVNRIHWDARSIGSPGLLDVAAGNGRFVAVGYGGTIALSADGQTWTIRHSGTQEALRGVAYGDGTFIAVGNRGIILRSFDGASWSQLDSGTTQYLNAVAFANGKFVAVGLNGTVLKSYNGTDDWHQAYYTGTTKDLYGVEYGDGAYVAVGRSGAVVTSQTGEYWTGSLPRTTNSLIGVACGDTSFVTVGGYGMILQSAPVIR